MLRFITSRLLQSLLALYLIVTAMLLCPAQL
jgi:hypothetical protein